METVYNDVESLLKDYKKGKYYLDSNKLNKLMTTLYSKIDLTDLDQSIVIEGSLFSNGYLVFNNNDTIIFQNCVFQKDTIIKNMGTGAIKIENSTLDELEASTTGSVLVISNEGDIFIKDLNQDKCLGSKVKIKTPKNVFVGDSDIQHLDIKARTINTGNFKGDIEYDCEMYFNDKIKE